MNQALELLPSDYWRYYLVAHAPENSDSDFTWEHFASVVNKDLFRQTVDLELIYYVTHTDGRKERIVHAFKFRYLFRYEVQHLLARCGFQVEDVFADYDNSSFGSKYPGELIMVARKS